MGSTIQQVEDRMRTRTKNRYQLYIFDKNDKEIGAYDNGRNSVDITKSMLNKEGATVTFNRNQDAESRERGFGGTFMGNEIENFANSKWKEMRIVSGSGNGESTYILKATRDNANKKALGAWAKGAANVLRKNYENSYNTQYEKALKGGKSIEQAHRIARQKATGMYHRNLQKMINGTYKNKKGETVPYSNFKDWGFSYVKIKNRHEVNRPSR